MGLAQSWTCPAVTASFSMVGGVLHGVVSSPPREWERPPALVWEHRIDSGGTVDFLASAARQHQIVAAGSLGAGSLVRFQPPDRGRLYLYRVRVVQVTGEDSGLRDVGEYRAAITSNCSLGRDGPPDARSAEARVRRGSGAAATGTARSRSIPSVRAFDDERQHDARGQAAHGFPLRAGNRPGHPSAVFH